VQRLFSSSPVHPPSLNEQHPHPSSTTFSSSRTRSIGAEAVGYQSLIIHDPNPLANTGEVMMTLPDGSIIYRDRPAPVQALHYPLLSTFDREAWEYFIVKYRREHFIAHKQNQILIIRRIDHGIVHEVCFEFGIKPADYHSVSNATMERHFFTHFGPTTPSVARDRFSEKTIQVQ
jgi:hypothetical protein